MVCIAIVLTFALCMLPTFACFHVEIGQMKASDKDIGLAWERIETFLWKHIGPASVLTPLTSRMEIRSKAQ